MEQKFKCKQCLIEKTRIYLFSTNTMKPEYSDDKGKRWAGHTCPDCHRINQKARYVKKKDRK